MLKYGTLLKKLGAAAAVFWVLANSKLRQQGWLRCRLCWLEDCWRTMRLVWRRVGILGEGCRMGSNIVPLQIYRRHLKNESTVLADSRSCSDNDENVLCAAYDFLANGQGLAGS